MSNEASIRIVPGLMAPRIDEAFEPLELEEVVITEQGTVAGLPIVDFRMRDRDGKLHLLMFTGRIVTGIASAIQGVNLRIHGKEHP